MHVMRCSLSLICILVYLFISCYQEFVMNNHSLLVDPFSFQRSVGICNQMSQLEPMRILGTS